MRPFERMSFFSASQGRHHGVGFHEGMHPDDMPGVHFVPADGMEDDASDSDGEPEVLPSSHMLFTDLQFEFTTYCDMLQSVHREKNDAGSTAAFALQLSL